MARSDTINMEPDGLLTAAYNTVQELMEAGIIKPTKAHPEGEAIVLTFHALIRSRSALADSSWVTPRA
jgi:hypothetical protein